MFTPPRGDFTDGAAVGAPRPAGASHAAMHAPSVSDSSSLSGRPNLWVRPAIAHILVLSGIDRAATRPGTLLPAMSPFWIWTQVAIVVFVVIGMIVAITKLA